MLGEARKISLQAFGGDMVLLSRFQTTGLYNFHRKTFLLFHFLQIFTPAQGHEFYNGKRMLFILCLLYLVLD